MRWKLATGTLHNMHPRSAFPAGPTSRLGTRVGYRALMLGADIPLITSLKPPPLS